MARLDYIMKIIKATVQAILRARGLRKKGELKQAMQTLNGASESLTGMSVAAACAMPLAGLMDLLGNDEIDAPRALTMAEVIKECGHVYEAEKGANKQAFACYVRAFCLYDEVTRRAPKAPELADHESNIRELLQRLDAMDPAPLQDLASSG